MQIPKRFLKQFGKKSLSVFLAVLMIMSTMSVCFGTFVPAATITAQAANGDGMNDFVAAVEAYGKAGYKFPALSYTKDETGKDSTSWVITKTWSYTPGTYKEYELFRTVIKTLHTFVFNLDEYTVCKTHNSNEKCGDGWSSSTQANKCTDWGYVKDALIATLGSKYNALKNYNVDNLLNAILNYDEVPMGDNKDGPNSQNALARPSNGNANDYGSGSSNKKTPQRIWNDFVLNAPANAKDEIISNAKTINDIPANYYSKLYYRLGTQQCAQTWKDGCSNKTGNYHMAIQDQSDKAPTTAPTDTTVAIDKSALTAAQTAFGTTYANYFATTDKNGVLAISRDEATLTNVKAAIQTARTNVINAFGEDGYTKFLGTYPYARTIKNIDDALIFLGFQAIINEIDRLASVDYSSYNSTQLAGHLAALEEAYAGYKDLSDADKADILANYPDFKPDDVDAKIAEINAAYTRLLVVEKVDGIKANLNAYENKWTMADVDNDVLKYTAAYAAFMIIEQDYNTLKNLDKAVIAEIAGADLFDRVEALHAHLANLATGAELNELYTPEYQKFNSQVKQIVPSTDSPTLLAGLKQYDEWYSDLKTLLDRMAESLSAEDAELLYDGMNIAMKEYMDTAYAILNARVETQINIAYDLYTAHKAIYGPTVHYVSLESYKIVTESIGRIEVDAYDFMRLTPNYDFSEETIAKYDEMQPLLFEFEKFAENMGFDTFYQYKMADIEREDDLANESFRVNTNKDEDPVGEYITTDDQIAKVIKIIDTALTDPSVTGALGLDLGTMLTELVEGAIISDGFINTVVDLLYPLVLKEFGKVFANDLPKKYSIATVTYNKNLHGVFKDAYFEVYPDLLAGVLDKDKYPETRAMLQAAYDNFDKEFGVSTGGLAYTTVLDPAGGTNANNEPKKILDKTAWDSQEIRDENGKLKLIWGVDAAKEAGKTGDELKAIFYAAFDDAVEGLKPLLLALIANKDWSASQKNLASAIGQQVDLTLSASANSGYANLLVPIYEALGLPYTSVSDVEDKFTNETNTDASRDVALIIEAILSPIFTLVGRIGQAPLDTILGILPNLAYAMTAGMVTPLLSMLKTTIKYVAPVNCSLVSTPPSGGVDIDVGQMLNLEDLGIDLSGGLNSLLALLGIEGLPPIDQAKLAVLGELTTINSQRKEAIYKIDAGKAYHVVANKPDVLAYLAEYLLTAIGQPGVLDAIMGLFAPKAEEPAEGEENVTPEEGVTPEEPAAAELPELVVDILENVSTNPKAAIAAIVELLNFDEYKTQMLYDWFNGTNYEASTVVGFNPATEIYLDVDNDWTREKAEYVYNNLDAIINAVIAMLPAKEENATEPDAPETVAEGEEATEEEAVVKTLSSILTDLIDGLYTDETLTALAALLGKLDLNALLAGDTEEAPAEGEEVTPDTPETIEEGEDAAEEEAGLDVNALINDLLGINLGAFAEQYGEIAEKVEATKDSDEPYVHPFGVTDAASFVNELVNMLAPLNKVLDFLLAGGDLTIFDGEAMVTLYGSDGYNTAIIPLLEALGCTPVAAATGSDALKATLNALVAKLDTVKADPINGIFNLLPGLVYFLTSNGLSSAAQNLLKPALVVIETIRPIIDVMDIINNIEIGGAEDEATAETPETVEEGDEATEEASKKTLGDIFGGKLNLKALDANFVVDLISNLTGLNLSGLKSIFYDAAAALTKKDYTSASTLQTEWKTAEYNADFDAVDVLTVLLSYVVEWVTVEENGAALDKLLKTEGIGAAIGNIVKGVEITYATPNWMYFFDTKEEFLNAVANGMVIPSTLAALEYPNDWNRETAAYIAEELPELVDMVIGLINAGKTDEEGNALPTTLSALLTDLIGGIFTAETLNNLVGMITSLLENVNDELLNAGGYLLNVDLVNLKDYKAPETVDTIEEFATQLAKILGDYAPGIVELLFLGNDYRFFNKSNGEDSIVISGGNGYAEGLALILEALGCENLPATDGETKAIVEGVFASLAARIDAILANPVEEIIELLPNLIFFLNANGAGVALGNLLKPVNALLDKINGLLEKPISISDLIKIKTTDDEGNEVEVALDLEKLSISNVVEIVETATKLDLTVVEDILVNFCVGKIVSYDSISVNDAYKMTEFKKEDTITILLTIALLFVSNDTNAKALDELIGTEIISSIKTVFESAPVEYKAPAWYALDWDTVDYEKQSVGVVQSALTYPNDWTAEKSLYLADNLPKLVDMVVGMLEVNGVKYESLADLIDANVNIYTPDLFTTIQKALGDLLAGFEGDIKTIIDKYGFTVVDSLLNADIKGLLEYDASGVNDKESFIAALTGMLMEVEGVVEWLLLGNDYAFFADKDGKDIITLNGAKGYAEGLALILEALGVENLPAADGETEAIISGVLTATFDRVEEILANPVEEVIDILPNVIYFINANGLAAAVNNLAGAFNALALKLKTFDLNIALEDLLNIEKLLNITDEEGNVKDLAIGLDNLTLEAVIEVVSELTGLDLTNVADIFVDFALGRVQGYTGVNGKLNAKMVYDEGEAGRFNKGDMITLVVTAALLVLGKEGNAEKLNEMIGTDIITAINDVFAAGTVVYSDPDWDYCWDENGAATGESIPVIESAITYPNDWTAEKSQYLVENLPSLVDMVVQLVSGDDKATLSKILTDNVNVFTAKTLDDLVALITNLLGDIDAGLLEAAGIVLGADINGLKIYKAPETVDTVAEFADELANILSTYAPGVVEWLLLGDDFTFFVNDANGDAKYDQGEDIITINGAHGYAEGLALLLEALGCENLPQVYEVENLDTAATVKAVLASLAARIEAIFANPVEEVVNMLPNLLYFLNTNGVAAVVDNLTAALTALAAKLAAFDINLDINSLVDLPKLMGIEGKGATISLDNLTIKDILQAVSLMVDLDLTVLDQVLSGFALGKIEEYDSVSAKSAYKMVYADEFDKHHMLTVVVTAVLLAVFETEGNAEKLGDMIGTDIIDSIEQVFNPVAISYVAPTWEYPLADNGTVDAMKYSITYPNNWTEDTAKYVTELLKDPELDALIAGLIDSNYDSLGKLLTAKVNVFTSANLQAIVDLIANLLADIDDGLLDAAGVLLGADVVGLKAYKAPEGITTVDAFATELANVLNTYAKGIVEWLLLGNDYKFFVKDVKDGAPVDFITINGAHGYAEGLALLLEALGCEKLPAVYDGKNTTEEIVNGVLKSLAKRIDEILADPIDEVIELLPNLFYFLNTNGVAAVVDNLTAALTALLTKLEVFDIKLDINELVNLPKLMGIEDKYVEGDDVISLDNLTMSALLKAVALMTGLNLEHIEKVLNGFALGKVENYTSVSKEVGETRKMVYADEFDRHDMVTVVANLLLITIVNEGNEEVIRGLLGDDVYDTIVGIFNMENVDVKAIEWILTDKVGEVFTAIDTSELYEGKMFGPLYTEEMANYIADNFGEFVDNIIYLLGIEMNGISINSLSELINGILGGSLYNSENIIAIRDALVGVIKGIKDLEVNGKNVGKHIIAVLKASGLADVEAVAKVDVPTFTNDREQFVASLCAVLDPLSNALKWLLADQDLKFFVDTDKTDLITLPGAEGYAFGIIPLLEVLGCENIITRDAYFDAVEANDDVLLTSIIDPVLNRLDVIIENPAEEILSILPNIIYFINSKGVDAVIKNTLNAVYTLLNAINPIVKIDIYELIGIDFEDLTFAKIFEMILDLIYDATGYKFDNIETLDSIAELTVGTLEKYTSANGLEAYRMVYSPEGGIEGGKAELVTVVLRLLVRFLMHENNADLLIDLLKDNFNMSEDAEKYMRGLLDSIMAVPTETFIGMDQALATIYYVYYGADLGVGGLAGGLKDINAEWQKILAELGRSDNPDEITIGNVLADFLDKYMDGILTDQGVAPNGVITFFQRIADWFNKIIEFFKNLFGIN